jgi:hypothetical protein
MLFVVGNSGGVGNSVRHTHNNTDTMTPVLLRAIKRTVFGFHFVISPSVCVCVCVYLSLCILTLLDHAVYRRCSSSVGIVCVPSHDPHAKRCVLDFVGFITCPTVSEYGMTKNETLSSHKYD